MSVKITLSRRYLPDPQGKVFFTEGEQKHLERQLDELYGDKQYNYSVYNTSVTVTIFTQYTKEDYINNPNIMGIGSNTPFFHQLDDFFQGNWEEEIQEDLIKEYENEAHSKY